jgi:hypothetical protein
MKAQDKIIKNLQAESGSLSSKLPADTSKKKWKAGGMYRLSLGQGTLSNWAAGGDDFSLNVNTALNVYAVHKNKKFKWENSLDLVFGFINTTSLGSRKNDDRIDFTSKYDYPVNPKLNAGILINGRTQFFRGYSYPENVKTYASNFFSPGYVLGSIGVDYKPIPKMSIFLSPLTSRWVIVKNDSLAGKAAYGVDTGKNSINQLGSFATINFQRALTKTLSYKTRLDMFSNYKKNPWNIDVYMTNLLAVKIFKMLSFNWTFDVIYDDDTRIFGDNKDAPALQLKSIVGAGLQVPI